MLMASISRSSMGSLLYLLGICHHSRLPPAGTEAAAGDAAGLGDAGDGATDGDAACSNSEDGDPALKSRIYSVNISVSSCILPEFQHGNVRFNGGKTLQNTIRCR